MINKCNLGVGQKNRTEPSQTKPTEQKQIQTKPTSISNHSVEDLSNPNGSVRFGFNRTEPRNRCVFVLFKLKILVIPIY